MTSRRIRRLCRGLVLLGLNGLVLRTSFANKFETIGGGVAGSNSAKLALIQYIGIAAGLFFLVAALLSATVGRGNPLTLNYSVWKQSTAVLLVLSLLSFLLAAFA